MLDTVFEYACATEILNIKGQVIREACTGCREGRLSQRDHTCLSLSEYEQLETYMNDMLREVNVTEVLRRWESIISGMPDLTPDLVDSYRLQMYRRDWRETMDTKTWKSKMYRLTSEFIRLRLCT